MDEIDDSRPNGKPRFHWYARYPNDFEGDTRHLTDSQYRAYSRLIDRYYLHGSIPTDDEQLALIVGKPLSAWRAIKPAVKAMFAPNWRDFDIEERLAEARENYAKLAAAGRRGGRAKADNRSRSDASDARPIPRNDASDALATTSTSRTTEEGSAACKEAPPSKGTTPSVEGSATVQEGEHTRGDGARPSWRPFGVVEGGRI